MEIFVLWLIFVPAAIVAEAIVMPDMAMYLWLGTIVVAMLVSKGNRSAG